MTATRAYAALSAQSPLAPFEFTRRAVGPKDVRIEITHCGVCHSDIHQARGEWGQSMFPMVPGHEIIGTVESVGAEVTKFKKGETVGVGCFVDSCRTCPSCGEGLEQYCEGHLSLTYNSTEKDGTPTFGGYSKNIIVDENYVLRVPARIDRARAAPLLCAGITTYSPLRHWGVGNGHRVGVVGLGGLGHMAVKFAAAFGAEVTVLSTSPNKEADARKLGAHNFLVTSDTGAMQKATGYLDFIIDTVSAQHAMDPLVNLLRRDGVFVLVGVPPKPVEIGAFSVVTRRRRFAGSMIGGIQETQEMLTFCADHNIGSEVEVINMADINQAYERMLRGDVRYRFVIDMATL